MTGGDFAVLALVGIIAGWLTRRVTSGDGFGVRGDLLLGIVGGVVGGLLAGVLGVGAYGFPGRVFVAFLGAAVLVGLARLLRGRPAAAARR